MRALCLACALLPITIKKKTLTSAPHPDPPDSMNLISLCSDSYGHRYRIIRILYLAFALPHPDPTIYETDFLVHQFSHHSLCSAGSTGDAQRTNTQPCMSPTFAGVFMCRMPHGVGSTCTGAGKRANSPELLLLVYLNACFCFPH